MKKQLILAFFCVLMLRPVAAQTCGPGTGVRRVTGWPITGGDDTHHLADGRIASPVFDASSGGPLSKLYIRRQISGDCPTCGHRPLTGLTPPELTERDRFFLSHVRWHFYKPCPPPIIRMTTPEYEATKRRGFSMANIVRDDSPAWVAASKRASLAVASAASTSRMVAAHGAVVQAHRVAGRMSYRLDQAAGFCVCFGLMMMGFGVVRNERNKRLDEHKRRVGLRWQRLQVERGAAADAPADSTGPRPENIG
jgi:hypothetical protein